MLFLVFQLGRDRYALDATQVVEVLPLVRIKALPQAPAGIAGLCNYSGRPVPVIDLSAMALGRPAQARLSTRLILTHWRDATGREPVLGLIAEQATDTIRRNAGDFAPAGVDCPAARYLGPVTKERDALIQRIEAPQLLTPEVRAVLFQAMEAAQS
jgi:chemotaxis-related protein WspB